MLRKHKFGKKQSVAKFRMHHGRQKYGGGSPVLRILVVGSLAAFVLWLAAVFMSDRPMMVVPQAALPELEEADTQQARRRTVSAYFLPQGYAGQVVLSRWFATGFAEKGSGKPDWVAWELTKERVENEVKNAGSREVKAVPDSLLAPEEYVSRFIAGTAVWRWEEMVAAFKQWAVTNRHLYVVAGIPPDDGERPSGFFVAAASLVEPHVWERAFVFPDDGGAGEMEVYEVGVEVVEERCGFELFGF